MSNPFASIDTLKSMLIGDPILRNHLDAAPDVAAAAELIVQAASRHGIFLNAQRLSAAFHSHQRGVSGARSLRECWIDLFDSLAALPRRLEGQVALNTAYRHAHPVRTL